MSLTKNVGVAKMLERLSMECLLVDKSVLPCIQPNFSPEYAYLSLQDKSVIDAELRKFDKSKTGLINMLHNITIPGTNVLPFIECLISQCALDQTVLNTEEHTYCKIRHLLEINI